MAPTRGSLEREIDRLSERLERILAHRDFDASHLVGIDETVTSIEARATGEDRRHIATRIGWMLRQHGLPVDRSDAIRVNARDDADTTITVVTTAAARGK